MAGKKCWLYVTNVKGTFIEKSSPLARHHKSREKHHKSREKHHKSREKHQKSREKHHKSREKHHNVCLEKHHNVCLEKHQESAQTLMSGKEYWGSV